MQSEQQQRIMGYFIEEAKDHLNTIEQGLLNLQSTIADSEMMNEVFRAAHSIKGGAAMLGLNSIQRVSHRLEDFFKLLKESPVQIDQRLETQFLRVFDALQELVGQLQGPFGLTDESSKATLEAVEPVFEELEQQLKSLVVATPGVGAAPLVDEHDLRCFLTQDVPARLREMLHLFKQPETGESRQELVSLCRSLANSGHRFQLIEWCQLLDLAQRAIDCSDNSYRILAPIVIKDIKQAQELLLNGQGCDVNPCAKLQELAPIAQTTDIATQTDFSDLADLDDGFNLTEGVDSSFDLTSDLTDLTSLPLDGSGEPPSVSLSNSSERSAARSSHEFDLSDDLDLSAEFTNHQGPEVGSAELNSLADLFEGENPDLGLTWHQEEILEDASSDFSMLSTMENEVEDSDFADLLFDNSTSSNQTDTFEADDFGDLFEDELLLDNTDGSEGLVAPNALSIEAESLSVPGDLEDFLGMADLSESVSSDGSESVSAALSDQALFGDALNSLNLEDLTPETASSDGLTGADADLPLDNLSELFAGLEDHELPNGGMSLEDDASAAVPDSASDTDWFTAAADPNITAEQLPGETDVPDPWSDLGFSDGDLESSLEPTIETPSAQSALDEFDDLFANESANPVELEELSDSGDDLDFSDFFSQSSETPSDIGQVEELIDQESQDFEDGSWLTDALDFSIDPQETALDAMASEPLAPEQIPDPWSEPTSREHPPEVGLDLATSDFSVENDFSLETDEGELTLNLADLTLVSDQPLDDFSGELDPLWGSATSAHEAIDRASVEVTPAGEMSSQGAVDLPPLMPEDLDLTDLSPASPDPDLEFIANSISSSTEELSFMDGVAASAIEDADLVSGPLSLDVSELADFERSLEDSVSALDFPSLTADDLPADLGDLNLEDEFSINDNLELELASLVQPVPEEEEISLDLETPGDDLEQFLNSGFEVSSTQFDPVQSLLQDDSSSLAELSEFSELTSDLNSDTADFSANDFLAIDLEPTNPDDLGDEFGALDDLLNDATPMPLITTDQGDLNAVAGLVSPSTAEEEDFADLEALLGDEGAEAIHVASSAPAKANSGVDATSHLSPHEFADLDALLEDDISLNDARISGVQPSSAPQVDDDFAELDSLLKDAEERMGGSPTIKGGSRIPAPQSRRPNRPGRGFIEQTMRVPVKHLDNLSNLVGELVVNRNSLEQDQERLRQSLDNLLYQVQQLSDVGQRMQDLYERSLLESSLLASRQNRSSSILHPASSSTTSTHTAHSTGIEYDPLEMDRFTGFHSLSQEMIELIVRVRESSSDIEFIVDEAEQVTRMFRQVTTQLQEGLTRSRMVPFAQTADRLPRAVRDISMQVGKQAELQIEGRETLIDKMILEELYDPMTHLVNNAITHGIESPEVRQAAGKPAAGRIIIRAFHQGNQTIISVSDDGAGIDVERVKAKAIEKGLLTASEAQAMTRLDVYDLLFHAGFSTKDKADAYSGRGVGMDVVRTKLSEIRGVINTDSTPGKGTTFTIRLPLTLSISKALCCVSDRARIAFPMDGVEDMLDVPRERIQNNSDGEPCIPWRDTLLPVRPLTELLGYNRHLSRGNVYGGNQEDDIISIVVLRSAGNFLALQVDQVLGEQEIVIKQLEGPIPKPVGVAGATVLGDGRIMPIADVLELIDLSMGRIRKDVGGSLWEKGGAQAVQEPPTTKSDPTVLIVDDSITVRELLSMTFNKVGYRVEQARDGQEAWEKLRSGLPCDIVFCDIEMPRMDGLELLSRLQKDVNLKQIPIAMLTSRGADRHRQMAASLGASGYFTKPYLEEALLDAAQRMLKGEVLLSSAG